MSLKSEKFENWVGKPVKLTNKDFKSLKEEDWTEVNRSLRAIKEWREKSNNHKSHCPIR